MTMECRILRKIDESEEGYYIVAEIVNILVDEAYLAEDGIPDWKRWNSLPMSQLIMVMLNSASELAMHSRMVNN